MSIRKVAIITGASRGIGAGLVAGYRSQDWAVVASGRTIRSSQDPDLLTVAADITEPATAEPDRRGRAGPLRPPRHPDQQRERMHRQAVRRLHRG